MPVEQINNKEELTYLHRDQQGSTRLITGSTGKVEGNLSIGEIAEGVGVAGVCLVTDGAGCVAAGLAALDAKVAVNDARALASGQRCAASADEDNTFEQVAGFAAGAALGHIGDLSPEIQKALEDVQGGDFAGKQLKTLGITAGTMINLANAREHETSGACSCN